MNIEETRAILRNKKLYYDGLAGLIEHALIQHLEHSVSAFVYHTDNGSQSAVLTLKANRLIFTFDIKAKVHKVMVNGFIYTLPYPTAPTNRLVIDLP